MYRCTMSHMGYQSHAKAQSRKEQITIASLGALSDSACGINTPCKIGYKSELRCDVRCVLVVLRYVPAAAR